MNFTITRKNIIKLLVVIAICLIGLSLLTIISTFVFGRGNIYGLIPLFSLDREANIPTIFSTLLLASSFVSFLLFG